MDYFAGLDVSVKETSVCIVDETGKIVREVKLASEPDALVAVLYHELCCSDRQTGQSTALDRGSRTGRGSSMTTAPDQIR
jgi:hypothetical protein